MFIHEPTFKVKNPMDLKILVVEDNADSRELLHFYLTSKGYKVSTAADGQEGLYMARVEKPDLVITDLTMPNMDGIELTAAIRSEPEISAIPIFVYTSYGSEAAEPAIREGATKVFYKPIDIDNMLNSITDVVEQDGPSSK